MTTATSTQPASREPSRDAPLFAPGTWMSDEQAETIWREIAFGYWQVLAAVDADGTRHVAIVPAASRPVVDWSLLTERERLVLALVARGFSQKVIAPKLGLSRSAISAAFQSAKERLGFRSANALVRACQGDASVRGMR